jgi:hypothetical protein
MRGGYHVVRGAFPLACANLGLRLARKNKNQFWGIHSLESEAHEGPLDKFRYSVGRLIIHLSPAHKEALIHNEETHQILVPGNTEFLDSAATIAKTYSDAVHKAAESIGIKIGNIDEQEILTQVPHSMGQSKHQDNWKGVWNAITPLSPSRNPPMTQLYKYPNGYMDYPTNMSPESGIPDAWDTMELLNLTWDVGDILFIRSNYIHNGPPNPLKTFRHVLFATEASVHHEFTDTEVILNDVFNKKRDERRSA